MSDLNPSQGLTRRAMIQRVAIGGAVAWAAPAVIHSSMASAAPKGSPCDRPFVCGTALNKVVQCGNHTGTMPCVCIVTVEGNHFCAGDLYCTGARACTRSTQCPAGWMCQAVGYGCCGRVCIPPCGTKVPKRTGRRNLHV